MSISRRRFLAGSASFALATSTGCAARYGEGQSYLTGVVAPENRNPVFRWTDIALQAIRDQIVVPPLAARGLAMGHVAGFLAVNGLGGPYENGYAIGEGPRGADPEVAYGVAAATAFAEHFQQPFLFDRRRFLSRYADGEPKSLGFQWGRDVGAVIRAGSHE